MQTALAWARDEFADLKTALREISTDESEAEVCIDRDLRRIKVRFHEDPAEPSLMISQDAKPDLAPDLISGATPHVEMELRKFDATYDGAAFGWVSPDDLESPLTTDDVAVLIRDWASTA